MNDQQQSEFLWFSWKEPKIGWMPFFQEFDDMNKRKNQEGRMFSESNQN